MSLQDLGKDDISEETHHLLDKVASKDSENAGLRSQLLKREADLNELRSVLDETINKLRTEADRALRFEADLTRKSEELSNEKIASQNAASALRLAQEKIQSEHNEARTLEATLDTMTLESDNARSQRQALETENKALQQRIHAMEINLKNLAAQPPPSQIPKRGHRPRSSSVTDLHNPTMEKEINDARLMLGHKDKQLQQLEDKLSRLGTQLISAENERVAGERSTQAKLRELEAALEEKERELEALRNNDGAAREEELLARIDEDEAKIAALELQLRQIQVPQTSQKELGKLQAQLSDEKKKSAKLESKCLEIQEQKEDLLREKGALSQELAQTSRQRASLQLAASQQYASRDLCIILLIY
ncbi:hypothetical protein CONPUDRAFT_44237 [Coniophora puteana RWD-64-598 SS2]|uniref:Uncharacterized protein n=1 Tax=Coniophora puteana (strain RWD-64-598) TaxID=741705 RepID=A0A5M3N6A1_CONPW|nr:uncharacterized protein CONPUDRAFT_44237 [Coniophora puteana RWD-64-598 SS2]EIW86970.1 hypothetical protein CONPUDRAFT_44237 [Coniophora puteana RWD-64-598 SS2]